MSTGHEQLNVKVTTTLKDYNKTVDSLMQIFASLMHDNFSTLGPSYYLLPHATHAFFKNVLIGHL